MSRRAEIPLSFHSLYDSPVVAVRDYCCRACKSGPQAEEISNNSHVVLMRRGAFTMHFGKRSVTADTNQAVFFSPGAPYRVSHPTDDGDRGTIFAVAPRVLRDIVRELDPSVDDRPDRPFKSDSGPCDARLFWRHRDLVRRLEAGDTDPLDPLWADVTALQLVADVLEAAFAQSGHPNANGRRSSRGGSDKTSSKRRRDDTDRDHADRTEAAKTFLASNLSDRITLDDVARAACASPFHLARIFQRHTGMPVHRYLTQLRLRASLERLAGGDGDLTGLALDLGFSSHSHFTDAFTRAFGVAPSRFRESATGRSLREMSKNLEV